MPLPMCPNPTNPTFMTNAPVRLRIASRDSMGIDQTEPDADRKYDASADYHLNDRLREPAAGEAVADVGDR
jgi:hypothetical protein